MKTTIKELGHLQKVFNEAIKFPMAWETAKTFEKFLKDTDEIVKQALEDFGMKEKKDELIKQLNEEITKRFENEKDTEENVAKDPEELKKKIAEEINKTEAAQKEKEINDEFYGMEVDVEPITYILDESLPGIFNLSMKYDQTGLVIFRERKPKTKKI